MADNSVFTAELVTPERVLVSGPAAQVILRTADGDITFLGGHTPLVGAVEPGVVRVVSEDGEEQRVAVHGGFVPVALNVGDDSGSDAPAPSSSTSSGPRAPGRAGSAEPAEESDTERARGAHEAAEARGSELEASGRTAGAGSPAAAAVEG